MSVGIIDNTEAIKQIHEKQRARRRFDKSQQAAKKKAVIRDAQMREKKGLDVCLPSGEPLRFPADNATVKRFRRSDRRQEHEQCRNAAFDGGKTVVTGDLRVQRANLRSLALGA